MKRLLLVKLAFLTMGSVVYADSSAKIYGDFRLSYAKEKTKSGTTGNIASTSSLQAVNNASRLGFKGSRTKGDLEGFFHYQMGAVNDDNTTSAGTALTSRFYFFGLKTKFGTIMSGRLSTPYKMAGVKLDNFYDTSAGASNSGANFGLSGLTNGFTNDAFVYSSPKFMNVQVFASAFLDDSDTDAHDYDIGLRYAHSGITIGVHQLAINRAGVVANSTTGMDAMRAFAHYKKDKWNVGFSYEKVEGATKDSKYNYLNAGYNYNPGSKVAISYGKVSDTGSKTTDGVGYSLGYFHEILPMTTAHLLVSRVEYDDDITKRDTIAFGFSSKFDWSIK
jgi:hypothetical protein